ncbi:probable serine/threonine-protein kinase drkD [Lineus longissimus]|uniref:probable serine/threonine-protein kinase drkD n=1 Tax=Lineus longissimus TaxID=88925 RepID=UPI002B4EA0F5
MAGRDVTKVVNRVEDAKEDKNLDLSDCRLMKVPDAIFLLLKNTMLTCCNLSQNTLRSLPSKIGNRFTHLSALILCDNQLTRLPNEIDGLCDLKTLDISNNSFAVIPQVIYRLQTLKTLHAEKNIIADIDVEKMTLMNKLAFVDVQENPLNEELRDELKRVTNIKILLTEKEEKAFEDID